jgi:hypothetical protein
LNKEIQKQLIQAQAKGYRRSKLQGLFFSGLIIIAFGAYVAFQEQFVYSKWIVVQGQVLDIKIYSEKKSDRDEYFYDFKVEYPLESTTKYIENKKFSGKPKFKIGDGFPVQINPKNTKEVRAAVGSGKDLALMSLIMGGILTLLGSLGFRKKR